MYIFLFHFCALYYSFCALLAIYFYFVTDEFQCPSGYTKINFQLWNIWTLNIVSRYELCPCDNQSQRQRHSAGKPSSWYFRLPGVSEWLQRHSNILCDVSDVWLWRHVWHQRNRLTAMLLSLWLFRLVHVDNQC